MTDSTCPDSNCRFRNRFGYCTVTTCIFVPTKVAIREDPDWVRVVRCRDCESWWPDTNEENCSSGFCRNQFGVCGGQTTDMNWFCADGEREG